MIRTTKEVVESHLQLRLEGDLEEDLRRNYDEDVILLSAEGVNHGHDGVRKLASVLDGFVPQGSYTYEQILHAGDMGMLHWHGTGEDRDIHDGADSYLIRDGLIAIQTIHYSTRPATD